MAQCILCGADASILTQKKVPDGVICAACAKKIPRVLHETLSLYSHRDIIAIIDYEEKMRKKGFAATASYGKLHIDEMNGLFAICDKVDSNGTPVGTADIFDCIYLESVGLYPIDPRQLKKDIVCDVEFNCVIRYPAMKFKVKIKAGDKCEYKQISKTKASWSEPGVLSMFRNMLDQTIKTGVKKAMEERDRAVTPYEVDMLKARACLHVYEGCPIELVESQYESLKAMYENGNYKREDAQGYIDAITRYYKMLIAEYESKK